MGSCVPGPTVLKAWLSWLKSGFLLRLIGLPAALLAIHLEVYGSSPAATSLILRRLSRRLRLSSLACKFEDNPAQLQLQQEQEQQLHEQLQQQLQQQILSQQLHQQLYSPKHVRSASSRSVSILTGTGTPGLARHRHRSSTGITGMQPLFLLGDVDIDTSAVGLGLNSPRTPRTPRTPLTPKLLRSRSQSQAVVPVRKRSATLGNLDNKGRTGKGTPGTPGTPRTVVTGTGTGSNSAQTPPLAPLAPLEPLATLATPVATASSPPPKAPTSTSLSSSGAVVDHGHSQSQSQLSSSSYSTSTTFDSHSYPSTSLSSSSLPSSTPSSSSLPPSSCSPPSSLAAAVVVAAAAAAAAAATAPTTSSPPSPADPADPPAGPDHQSHRVSSPSLPLLSAVSSPSSPPSPAFTLPPPSPPPPPPVALSLPPPPSQLSTPPLPSPRARCNNNVSYLDLTAQDKDLPATPLSCDLFSPLPSASTASPGPSPVFTPFTNRFASPEPLFTAARDATNSRPPARHFFPLFPAASPVFTASSHDLDGLDSASTADTLCESEATETVCELSPPPSPFPSFAPPLFGDWRLSSPPPSATPVSEVTATPSPPQRAAPPAPLPIAIASSYNSPLSYSPAEISPFQDWKRPSLRPRPFSLSAVPVAFSFTPQRSNFEDAEPASPTSTVDISLPSRPSTPGFDTVRETSSPSPYIPSETLQTPAVVRPVPIVEEAAPLPEPLPVTRIPSPSPVSLPSVATRPTRSPSAPIISTPAKQVNFALEPVLVDTPSFRPPPLPLPVTPSPTTRPRMSNHSRSMSHADALKNGKRLSLQHTGPSISDGTSPRPQSWVAASPALASPEPVSSPTDLNILAVLAAQERYVLELKEELAKAENDLEKLKKAYFKEEASKKHMDHRKITQLQPLNTTLANIRPDEQDEDGSNTWMQKEMERRKALLSSTKSSQRKTFSGSRHLRTLSLLSPDKSYTPSFPQPADIRNSIDESVNRPQTLARSTTNIDIANQVHNNLRDERYDLSGLPNIQREALLRTGKQMATDLKDGLFNFFEDIRQATVGEDAIEPNTTTKPAPSKSTRKPSVDRPGLERSASSKQKGTDIGDDFWKQHGLNEPKVTPTTKKSHPVKNSRTPQKQAQKSEDFEEWDSWDTPNDKSAAKQVATNNSSDESDEPSSPSSGGNSSRSSRDLYHAKRHDSKASSLTNASFNEDGTVQDSKRNSLQWPDLVKLSPTNLKRTASHLMKEWEKNLTPPAEAREASHISGDYIGRSPSPANRA